MAPAARELTDTETRRIIGDCYQQAVETLRGSRDRLDRLAHTLLDQNPGRRRGVRRGRHLPRNRARHGRPRRGTVSHRTHPDRSEKIFCRTGGVSRPGRGLTRRPGPAARWGAQRPASSASGQQGPAGRHERGRERLEQLLERGAAVGLTGHERPVDGGQREARELLGDRAPRIVAERGRDLGPQEIEGVLADPADDSLDLSLTRGGGLGGEDDQQPEEVRVALERADGSRHHPGQVLCRAPGPPGQAGQVGEEAIGAAHPDIAGFLVGSGLDVLDIPTGLAPRALRDIQAGQATGRFTVADAEIALSAATGGMLGLLRMCQRHPERVTETTVDQLAEAELRLLGVPAPEAARLAALALPDTGTW